jgi:hypothetical protein
MNGLSIDTEHIDITIYLSALNRFKSCTKHIWTVYHIFTDCLKIWAGTFYKLVTRRIDIIVETSTNETWLMRKVEQGKLKIQLVVTCQSVLACWVIKDTNVCLSGASI